jgi:RNase P/RNase MRP subunit p29
MNGLKLEINKKLIGKSVKVIDKSSENEWVGLVTDVIDEETFSVSNGEGSFKVDIFDIRSLD